MVAAVGTVLYEIFIFGFLFRGVGGNVALSSFVTYFFSFMGAIPIVLVLLFLMGGEVKRNHDINTTREYYREHK